MPRSFSPLEQQKCPSKSPLASARQALPHRRPHRPRRQAEGRGQGHHRPGRRRARLRHAGAHRRGRHRGDQRRLHALHRRRRHPGTQGRHHREVQARQRPHLHAPAGPGVDRREADDLQPVHGGDRPGRRGADPRARTGCRIPTWRCWPKACRSCRTRARTRATRSRPDQLAHSITRARASSCSTARATRPARPTRAPNSRRWARCSTSIRA